MENAPAEGERRAIRGYHPQYQLITSLTHKRILNGTLKAIRLVDPTAGSIDDFQIITEDRLDAYQIKWHLHPGNFTFNNLCSVLDELVDGWKRLKSRNNDVKVHYFTNKHPSVHDSVKDDNNRTVPTPNHFSHFLMHFWLKIKNDPENYKENIPPGWEGVWKKFLSITGLDESQLVQFIIDCDLDFDQSLPSDSSDEFNELYHFLLVEVFRSETGEPLEITRSELLSKLGWNRFFELRNQQFFNLADDYIPNDPLIEDFNRVVSQTQSGYIAIMGPPGIGKSSFIANIQTTDETRLIKYYIHLQESFRSVTERAESVNYLHDILLMLERRGIRGISKRVKKDLHELREDFRKVLVVLNNEWRERGIKTFIMIDGLDHILRNPPPSYSLLNELIIPQNIPDGVIFVLGTQSMNFLSQEIKSHVEDDSNRKIELDNLSRSTVHNIIEGKIELSYREKDLIFRNSSGHPLVLKYILNFFILNPERPFNELILEVGRYEGNLDNYYNTYWNTIEGDREKKTVFGIVSRIRRFLDKNWFLESFGIEKFEVIKEFIHFFNVEHQNKIFFFHESFREFLYRKTMEFQGELDVDIDQTYHKEIASKIELSLVSPMRNELIYHLSKSNQKSELMNLATQEFFRNQFFNLRPVNEILNDINLAIRCITSREDLSYLVRFILIGSEIYQRRFNIHLQKEMFYEALIQFNKYEEIIHYCTSESTYLLDKRMKMKICAFFGENLKNQEELETENFQQFKSLFYHSEPLEIFDSDIVRFFDQDYLKDWAIGSSFFDDPTNIIRKLNLIGTKGRDKSESRTIRNNLILEIIKSTLKHQFDGYFDRIRVFRNCLDISKEEDLPYYLWSLLYEHWWVKYLDDNRDNEILSELKRNLGNTSLHNLLRLQITKELIKTGNNPSDLRGLTNDLVFPNISEELSDLIELILYIGVKSVLDVAIINSEIDSISSEGINNSLSKSAIIIGNLLGIGLNNNQLDSTSLNNRILEIFNLLKNYYRSSRYSTYNKEKWLELFEWLTSILSNYFADLQESWGTIFFENLLDDPDLNGIYWSLELKRELLTSLSTDFSNRDRLKEYLISLNSLIYSELEPYELITHHLSLTHIFIDLEDFDSANEHFDLALNHSLGLVGRKDYQLDGFIALLRYLFPYDNRTVLHQVELMNRIIPLYSSYAENDIIRNCSSELLNTAFTINPAYAVEIFNSMISGDTMDYFMGLESLLTAAMGSQDFDINIATKLLEYYFIPLESVVPSDFIEAWMKHVPIETKSSNNFIVDLLNRVNTYALPNKRKDWITEFLLNIPDPTYNLSPNQMELLEKYDFERYSLRLKNNEIYKFSELIEIAKSPQKLFELYREQEENTEFDWYGIILNCSQMFNHEDIKRIIVEFNNIRIQTGLMEKYYHNEEFEKVILVIKEILKQKSRYEWGPYSRSIKNTLNALQTLFEIDDVFIEEIGIPFLIKSISESIDGPFQSMFSLPDIVNPFLPFLTRQSVEDCWKEIDEYLKQLLENTVKLIEIPEDNPTLEEESSINALLSVILVNIEEIIEPLQYFSQKVVLHLLDKDIPMLINLLQKDLENAEIEHYGKLVLLHTLLNNHPEYLTTFKPQLISLYSSNNLYYRSIIHSILIEHNEAIPKLEKVNMEKFNQLKERTDNEREVGLDIAGMINTSLMKTAIVSLSMDTGISKETLIACLKQLIVEKYSEIAIKDYLHDEIMAHYNNIGLSFYGKKPQFFPVRNAFFELLAILYDSYYLHSGIDNFGYERLFHFYDPLILNFEPVGKAQIIEAVQREDYLDIEKFFDISIPDEYILNKLSDYYILGEFTRYRILERPFPVENRKNFVFFEKTIAENDFENITDIPLAKYHNYIGDITGRFISNRLILYNKVFFSENEGVNWIAFNPKLARQLKWKKSENGLCRWVNDNNETMVETIWWTDGFFKTAGFHFCDVGEGWLVVASSEALDKIKSLGGLKRKIVLQRYDRDNRREVTRIIDVTE